MQGRLSPPLPDNPQCFPMTRWRVEFALARGLGFDSVEWLFDATSISSNPLLSASGRLEAQSLAEGAGVAIASVCADYFKGGGLLSADLETAERSRTLLKDVIRAAAGIGAGCVVLPMVEGASLKSADARARTRDALKDVLALSTSLGVRVGVETDIPAKDLLPWLESFDQNRPEVCYDLGNAASSGFPIEREIAMLARWVVEVHVKDRPLGGPNVPLGTGAVNFKSSLAALKRSGYSGLLVFETVRGEDYLTDARRNLSYLEGVLASVCDEAPGV